MRKGQVLNNRLQIQLLLLLLHLRFNFQKLEIDYLQTENVFTQRKFLFFSTVELYIL